MQIITNSKRSCVYYDKNNDTFVKTFSPSFKSRLKYFFHLRKYPGVNFHYISKLLNKLDIKTTTILSYSHYSVTMKNVHGTNLNDYYKNHKYIINHYVDIIVKILNNGIYCGDLTLENFIVKDDEIYVIDMEDYRYEKFIGRGNKEALRRLSKNIPYDIFQQIEKQII